MLNFKIEMNKRKEKICSSPPPTLSNPPDKYTSLLQGGIQLSDNFRLEK